MSFGDDWGNCMRGNGLPIITLEDLSDVKEFIEEIHQAWENSGGDEEMTLGALAALGAATGLDEGILTAIAAAGAITLTAYVAGCVSCLVSAAGSALWDLLSATSPLQPFMVTAFNDLGVQRSGTATA